MSLNLNYKLIAKIISTLLVIESVLIASCSIISLIYDEKDWVYFVNISAVVGIVGLLGIFLFRDAKREMSRREGSLIVTLVWVVFSLIGMLPFWLSGTIPSLTDAFFETMSGFTTTGATIMENIESASHGMLFWRSMTHWVGGLGIVVISLALLPMFGFSGIQLFGPENTGLTKDKLHPKITGTAKRLMFIYFILTATLTILLRAGNMGWFDAVCHSFSTIATGGFSTKQASIGYWHSPYIQYVITAFMILAGINFSLFYYAFTKKWNKVKQNEELKYYLILILIFTALIMISIVDFSQLESWKHVEREFRDSIFQVASTMTSTGFTTDDYTLWSPISWVIIGMAMLIGCSAGSTGGGIKIIRILIVFKYCYLEFKRMIHPNAVIPVMYNRTALKNDLVTRVLAFVMLYLGIIFVGTLVLCFSGMDVKEAIGAVVSCQACVGPGFGSLGPMGTFAGIPDFCKWFLSFIMLIGRLELFTVLLLFTPVFWRK